jgi:hypothetical protein
VTISIAHRRRRRCTEAIQDGARHGGRVAASSRQRDELRFDVRRLQPKTILATVAGPGADWVT